jgi:hypothetical protein
MAAASAVASSAAAPAEANKSSQLLLLPLPMLLPLLLPLLLWLLEALLLLLSLLQVPGLGNVMAPVLLPTSVGCSPSLAKSAAEGGMPSLLQSRAGVAAVGAVQVTAKLGCPVAVMLWLSAAAALPVKPAAPVEALLGLKGVHGCTALLTRLLLSAAGGIAGSCAVPKFLQAEAHSSPGSSLVA